MVKKRKTPAAAGITTAATSATPPKKQQKKQDDEQSTKIVEEEKPPVEIPIEEDHEEEIEEEVEEEVKEEEEEQVDEDEGGKEEEEDEDVDSISSLIELFTKEQLITLLREAAENHPDVASRVRNLADKDVAHRKIFVHGLGWDTTAETLIAAFQQYGEIEDCKAVTDKLTGKSKGYGFILFKTRGGARKALREPQKVISGRTASCQLAAVGPTAGGNGQVAATPATEYTQKKIYVSNVSPDIDPNKLTAYFSKFGEIEEGPLGIDRSTGKFKGFCLYVYKSVESARKALEEPHKQFEGHTLHCQRAIDGPKHVKSGGVGVGVGSGGHGRGSGGGYVRGENPNLIGAVGGPPTTGAGLMGGVAGAGGLNPALGQALTALLATQGTGLGLNNLLGGIGGGVGGLGGMGGYVGQSSGYGGSAGIGGGPGVGGLSGYGSQGGLQSGYGSQGGLHSGYPNQQLGQGGFGRSQFGYNGRPYGGR